MVSLREMFRERLAEEAEKGIQQGIQQEITLIIRQIKRKIGDISTQLETRIRSLNISQIETLGEDLLDFNSHQDLLNWLDNNQ